MPRTRPLSERFWSKVRKGDGESCWGWTAYRMKNGYGTMGLGLRTRGKEFAHRVSWLLHYGQVPDGMYVCHKCDNPGCVRPDHLFLGSPKENQADMRRKSRHHYPGPPPGERNHKAKLTPETVRRVFELRAAGLTQKDIGAAVGVSQGQVSSILRGASWKHLPLPRQRHHWRRDTPSP